MHCTCVPCFLCLGLGVFLLPPPPKVLLVQRSPPPHHVMHVRNSTTRALVFPGASLGGAFPATQASHPPSPWCGLCPVKCVSMPRLFSHPFPSPPHIITTAQADRKSTNTATMTAQPDVAPTIVVDVPTPDDVKKAEERLAHYHKESHHFHTDKPHTAKRLLRIVIAGTGFLADSYDLFVINIGTWSTPPPTPWGHRAPPRGRIRAPCGVLWLRFFFAASLHLGVPYARRLLPCPPFTHPIHPTPPTALLMMKQNKNYGVLTPDVQAQISMMAIVGALTGQLFFGVLGDEVRTRLSVGTAPQPHM